MNLDLNSSSLRARGGGVVDGVTGSSLSNSLVGVVGEIRTWLLERFFGVPWGLADLRIPLVGRDGDF